MLKIGVLLNNSIKRSTLELTLLEAIQKSNFAEVSVIIQHNQKSYQIKNLCFQTLLKLQQKIEHFILKPTITYNKQQASLFLKTTPSLQSNQLKKLKKKKLDLIIVGSALENCTTDFIKIPKFGIWNIASKNHKQLNTHLLLGFDDFINKQKTITIALQKISENALPQTIDQAFFNYNFSFFATNTQIQQQTVVLLLKNLKKLTPNNLPATNQTQPISTSASITSSAIKYLIQFYIDLSKISFKYLLKKILGKPNNQFKLFIGEGIFNIEKTTDLKLLNPSKNEYWADPFLFEHQNKQYLFFENFSYKNNIGKISCGLLENNQLKNIEDVLKCNYHLSYPFIFKEGNEIFMIPETSANKKLEVYKCSSFPSKWELHATGFEGESIVDTTYYKDEQNQQWLLLNKASYGNDHCNELYIYQIDSLQLQKITPHKMNPIQIDARTARNAGPIFKSNGKLIRPSQQNTYGIYGHALNFNHIKKLSLEIYEEQTISEFHPNFKKGVIATHHLHQLNDKLFVLDAAFE